MTSRKRRRQSGRAGTEQKGRALRERKRLKTRKRI
jgi:hypothetical protein